MTIEEARQLVQMPKLLRKLIEDATGELERSTARTMPMQSVPYARGILKGLDLVMNIVQQAEQRLREAAAERAEQNGEGEADLIPHGLMENLLHPVKPPGEEGVEIGSKGV